MIAQSFSAPTCGSPTAFPDALGVRRHRTANNTGRRFKSKHHRTKAGRGRSARRFRAPADQLRSLHATGRPKRIEPKKGLEEKIDPALPIPSGVGGRCAAVARSIVKTILVRLGMEEWLTPRTAERLIRRWNLGAA